MKLNSFNITTVLLMAFGAFVLYTRLRNWTESNVPLIFYALLVVFVNSWTDDLPKAPVYAGLTLALLLRFEFMARSLVRLVKFAEMCALAVVLYGCYHLVFV